jgi:hypothetical protein
MTSATPAPEKPAAAAGELPHELDPRGDWRVELRPFLHVRARGVLREDCYRRIEGSFAAMLEGDPHSAGHSAFKQNQPGYDALILGIREPLAQHFAPFFEPRWIRFLAGLLGLDPAPQIDGALHHIPRNSRSGWVHNDFCSAWFDGAPTGELIFPDRSKCDYFSGAVKDPTARPVEYVRAATMIFYLSNGGWKTGDGGETGLYPASRADLGEVSAVPPFNNSLLLFECSPHSWHRLLANPGSPRNSIILWLHSTVEDAQSRWGQAVKRRGPE